MDCVCRSSHYINQNPYFFFVYSWYELRVLLLYKLIRINKHEQSCKVSPLDWASICRINKLSFQLNTDNNAYHNTNNNNSTNLSRNLNISVLPSSMVQIREKNSMLHFKKVAINDAAVTKIYVLILCLILKQ